MRNEFVGGTAPQAISALQVAAPVHPDLMTEVEANAVTPA